MSTTRALPDPPRFGMAILNRLAERNEALAGDLVEGFRLKRSRLWFWRELAGAIVTGGFRRAEIRPIRLVDFATWQQPSEDFAAKRRNLQALGLSASPVEGVGGISIVMVIFLISLLQPALWIVLAFGMILGTTAGAVRVYLRRNQRTAPDPPTGLVLFNHHGQ